MKKNIKLYIFYPLIIMLFIVFLYSLFLWSTNFTPRMFFYFENVNFEQKNDYLSEINFHSDEKYLGIISFNRIGEFIDYNAESLIVSLVESGNVIHSNSYNAYDLIDRTEFSFGFPIQENSKNKNYQIRLELICFENDSCIFNPELDKIMIRHYFPKEYLIKNIDLILEKVVINFNNQGFQKNIFIIFSPILLYFILISLFSEYMSSLFNKIKSFILKDYHINENLLYFPVIIDSFIRNDRYFILFLLLSLFIIKFKIQKKEMFYFRSTLLLYCLSLILVIVNIRSISDRLSVWVFIYFVCYCVNILYFSKIEKKRHES